MMIDFNSFGSDNEEIRKIFNANLKEMSQYEIFAAIMALDVKLVTKENLNDDVIKEFEVRIIQMIEETERFGVDLDGKIRLDLDENSIDFRRWYDYWGKYDTMDIEYDFGKLGPLGTWQSHLLKEEFESEYYRGCGINYLKTIVNSFEEDDYRKPIVEESIKEFEELLKIEFTRNTYLDLLEELGNYWDVFDNKIPEPDLFYLIRQIEMAKYHQIEHAPMHEYNFFLNRLLYVLSDNRSRKKIVNDLWFVQGKMDTYLDPKFDTNLTKVGLIVPEYGFNLFPKDGFHYREWYNKWDKFFYEKSYGPKYKTYTDRIVKGSAIIEDNIRTKEVGNMAKVLQKSIDNKGK
jgi:hypothetical protein